MLRPHNAGGFAVIGDIMYAFGGAIPGGGALVKESEYYDETSQSWKETTSGLLLPGTEFYNQLGSSFQIVPYSNTQAYSFGGAGANNICLAHVMLIDVSGKYYMYFMGNVMNVYYSIYFS